MKRLLWVLVILAVMAPPWDLSVIFNKILGMGNHIFLYLILLTVIFFMVDGKTMKEKGRNLLKALKR